MNEPTVSVLINCRNGASFLKESIPSVIGQTFRDWEIVFVDNASTDGSADLASGFDDRVRVVRLERGIPLGEARNVALRHARGKYLAFLDVDDTWSPHKLELQVALMDARPNVGICATDVHYWDGKRDLRRLYARESPPEGRAFGPLIERYNLSIQSVMIRAKTLDSLSECFDDSFHVCEEKDLFLRIAREWDVAVVREPLARWRVQLHSRTMTDYVRFAQENRKILAKLRKLDPGLDDAFGREVRALEAKIARQDALGRVLVGDRTGAWRAIKTVPRRRDRLALRVVSFFPPAAVARLVVASRRFR